MPTSTFSYPSLVSRTLDPSNKALLSVIALHDHEVTDADLNLIQQLQDYKRGKLVANFGVTSGATQYSPFQFNANNPNTFFIPAFDVLFNGQIITIEGQLSSDLTLNRMQLPLPPALMSGNEDACLYICFLEIWYQSLDPLSGRGYYQDPLNPGPKYFFPYGGILPDPSNAKLVPDDSVDPFQGLFTTERAQIQWRINIQRVALNYDFTRETFGFWYANARVPSAEYINNGTGDPGQIVYGQASRPSASLGVSPLIGLPTYQFTNMGSVNGDTGLWRCGDGNVNNSLGTMDGYSYAMPVAVVFQRNTGNFDVANNIFGCANPASGVSNTGTLATRISGRYDQKLADQVFPSEVVDTRTTISLNGIDMDNLMRKGFADLITGKTQLAVSRFGDPQGNKTEAVGSLLDYYLGVNPLQITNVSNIGTFDGFSNGFSSDQRTFFSTRKITTNQKATGTNGSAWTVGDSFAISLPQSSKATITSVSVTALVSNFSAGTVTPAALLQGQVEINGLNSATATVALVKNLSGTAFDPGSNGIYATIGVTYPAGIGLDTRKIPHSIKGGELFDASSGRTLPVFGVSEYEVQSQQTALEAYQVWAVNPEYSDIILGTKIWIMVPGSLGVVATVSGASQTTFVIDCEGLNEALDGLYVTRAWDLTTGNFYNIAARQMLSVSGSFALTQIQASTPSAGSATYVGTITGGAGDAFKGRNFTVLGFANPANNGTFLCTASTGSSLVLSNAGSVSVSASGTASNSGIQHTVVLNGAVQSSSTVVMSVLAQDTVQLAYNAPVKGATQIEETVLFGNYTSDANFPMDPRVVIESVSYDAASDSNTLVFGANGCQIKGISGDDTVRLIWVKNSLGGLTARTVTSAVFGGGTLTVIVSGNGGTVDLTNVSTPFLLIGSILPVFTPASTLILQVQYVPYQGEGVINRDYEILHSEDDALITTNGTGAAPVIGLSDVYPYNRELPIVTTLPAQLSWSDTALENSPVATLFDSNYVAMRANNVEHTFDAPLHTNDFIPPINKDTRKTVRFIAAGSRGFSQATPHLGFAIAPPTARTVLGQNLQSTQASIILYVDNVNGSDLSTGLTLDTAKKTIGSALAELPPVLHHPCSIIIRDTGAPFSIQNLQSSLAIIALGDGDIRSAKQYALGNLSRVIQNEGRLVITREATATNPVIIDATNFTGFGDGPTAAFYIDTSRVILNGLQFKGFTNPAIVAYNSDVDLVQCSWVNNVQAGAYVGCDSVILDGGSISLPSSGTGHVLAQSNLTASNHALIIPIGVTPQSAFFVATRASTMTLQQHSTGTLDETNISAATVIATAQLNSSIAVNGTFQSAGNAVISANSVLLRTVTVNPFLGGVFMDSSSSVVTQVG